MSTDTYILLSVLLAVVVIAVLAFALIRVRQGLEATSRDLAALADALEGVESEHLRPLEPAVKAINAQFDVILGALPGIGAQGGDRGRAEAAMTLWWIGNAVLLLVILPVVSTCCAACSKRPASIVPSVRRIAAVGGRRLQGPRRRGAAAHDEGPGRADGGRRGELRRLARRDRRRRAEGQS